MCDGFAMYSRRVNGFKGIKECAVLSTSELNKLRALLALWLLRESNPDIVDVSALIKETEILIGPEVFANANH